MQGHEKHSEVAHFDQISIADHSDLVGPATHIVAMSPEKAAKKLGLFLERAFDDLDMFDFLGFRAGQGFASMRRHIHDSNNYSLVTIVNAKPAEVEELMLAALDRKLVKLEEPWA